MHQAENVVTFPVNACTTDFLQDFIAGDAERLESVAIRLSGIAWTLCAVSNDEEIPPRVSNVLMLMEIAVRDALAIIDMRPVEQSA